MNYIKERCEKCVWYNLDTNLNCTRNFPRTKTTENCKIRMRKKAPWIDAFIKRKEPWQLESIKGWKAMDKKEKMEALDALVNKAKKKAEKKGSKVVIGKGSELPEEFLTIKQEQTGFPLLDSWSQGGFPSGGQISISGEPSVGKTSFALMMAGQYQRQGKVVAFVNYESVLDAKWAQKLGVDTDNLYLWEGEALEDGLDFIERATKESLVDLVIIDSLDAANPRGTLETKKGVEKDIDDDTMALKARAMSKWYPRVSFHFRSNNTTLILIGQHRTNLGGSIAFSSMSGGNARKYADLLYMKLSRIKHSSTSQFLEIGNESVAYKLKITVAKSKYKGLREGDMLETYFFFDRGFNIGFEYVTMALNNLIEDSPLTTTGTSTTYVNVDEEPISLRGSKPATIYAKLQEMGLLNELIDRISID